MIRAVGLKEEDFDMKTEKIRLPITNYVILTLIVFFALLWVATV